MEAISAREEDLAARENMLIIDDDEINRGILDNIFSPFYRIEEAENGRIGLNRILEKPEEYSAVLLDVVMPEMDGLEACNKIREFSNVPIILLTAKTDDMDVLMGFENGADDYLTKPFNILELKARVRALLRRSGAQNGGNQEQNRCCPITVMTGREKIHSLVDLAGL